KYLTNYSSVAHPPLDSAGYLSPHGSQNLALSCTLRATAGVNETTVAAILARNICPMCGLLDVYTRDKSTVDPGPRDTNAGPGACE
ncbi:hypothetical protein, partial [uncultured Corynebacterium sp.]|uniref:hypothetical protein n=1 Tax=uncultured Corynebacterium sp. TaxID=159447 RepID=UPI0025869371